MIQHGMRGPWVARIARAFVAALSVAAAAPASAQFCSNCILNSASPQVATFNVGSGTVRGTFTASTGTFVWLNATNLNVSNLLGNGSALTALNATQLTSGTVPFARLTGSYTGITGVGTLAAGTWQAGVIAPAYGGTGANLSIAGTAGGLPYFSGSGVQGVVTSPSGPRVLATAGSGAKPVWVSSPALTGENFSAIPLSALDAGTLPHSILVDTNSIPNTNGAGVLGNIPGGAAFLTVPLPVNNLAAGTLPTTNAASSITVTGVTPGTFGGPTTLAQITVRPDGRIGSISQFNLVVYSTQVVPGPLPPGVTIGAAQITSGTLAGDVIASSVAATAVTAGSYGAAARTLTATVGVDGRITAMAQPLIALPLSQLNNGTLPSGVKLPAASVNAGTLGSTVIASSIAANGVPAGVYGSPTVSAQITVGPDGRITNITQFSIPGASTSTAYVDRFNDWSFPQTSRSSWTFTNAGGIKVNAAVTAGSFIGQGTGITSLTPSAMVTGVLPADVIASSVAARKVGDAQLTLTGVTAGSKGTASRIPTITVDAQGRLTALTDQAIAITTGEVTGIVPTDKGGTGQDWSAVTIGRLPYFSGTGTLSTLAAGSANNVLVSGGAGAPSWSGAPTILGTNITAIPATSISDGTMGNVNTGGNAATATSLASGGIGQVPYQTAAGVTAFLPAMGLGGIISGNGTSAIPSTGTWTGTASQITVTRTGSNFVLSTPQNIATNSSVIFNDITGASYSSAPVMHVSSIQAPGALTFFTANGINSMSLRSTAQVRVGPGNSLATGTDGTLDVNDTPDVNAAPSVTLNNWDPSIVAGQVIGLYKFKTEDSSTGGVAIKAKIEAIALDDFTSGSQVHRTGLAFGISDVGAQDATNYMMLTSSGLYINDGLNINVSSLNLRGTSAPYDITTATGIYVVAGELRFKSGSAGVVFPDGTRQITAATSASAPTRQTFTSGSGTYNTPANARQLRITMCGGGGGGAGSAGGGVAGGFGGYSTFNAISAAGGQGGFTNSQTTGATGLTVGVGSANFRYPGNPGGNPSYTSNAAGAQSGGGSVKCGGGAPSSASNGISALDGSGGGGSGGSNGSGSGGGGAGGECLDLIINSPAASYSYAVGVGGTGSVSGTATGGNGGKGCIIVDELY